MINSKNYLIVIIPYLTFCCGIYHMIYWSLFGVNGLNLLSLEDLIKSSISPLALEYIFTSIGIYFAVKISSKKSGSAGDTKTNAISRSKSILQIILIIIVALVLYLTARYVFKQYYKLIATLLGVIAYILVDVDYVFAKDFTPRLDKKFLLMLMIYLPCITFSQALKDAFDIIENKVFQYTIYRNEMNNPVGSANDTLKYIGTSRDIFVFTTLKNDKTFFIKSDTMVLYQQKEGR